MATQTAEPKKKTALQISHIQSLPPAKLLDDDSVAGKFVELYNKVNGTNKGELVQHQQQFHYKKILSENPVLRECSPLSLYGVILDVAVSDLSLETGPKPDCYITSRNFKVGKDEQGKDVWEKRAQLLISPYGELKKRIRAGHIKYADNPVIVYEGDLFKVKLVDGKKVIDYEAAIPRKSKRIIASFIRLVRTDGSVDFAYLTEEDFSRFKAASNKQNRGTDQEDKANALYSSVNGGIDPGFLAAKTIKHAFSTYPKVPIGQFSALESEDNPEIIDYGINAAEHSANGVQDVDHEDVTNEPDEFDSALKEHAEDTQAVETVSYKAEDDEPDFN